MRAHIPAQPEMGGYAGTFGCKGSGGEAQEVAEAFGNGRTETAQVADQVRDALSISA